MDSFNAKFRLWFWRMMEPVSRFIQKLLLSCGAASMTISAPSDFRLRRTVLGFCLAPASFAISRCLWQPRTVCSVGTVCGSADGWTCDACVSIWQPLCAGRVAQRGWGMDRCSGDLIALSPEDIVYVFWPHMPFRGSGLGVFCAEGYRCCSTSARQAGFSATIPRLNVCSRPETATGESSTRFLHSNTAIANRTHLFCRRLSKASARFW
jgi:hypothetical protein